jgi:hypothetical protein
MRGTFTLRVAIVCLLVSLPSVLWARQAPGPHIHRATLRADTGILTIAGVNLGRDLHVTVDGQPVTVLPGATATQLDVLAPASLLTVPGSYRLTVADPVRRAWDGFVVSSPAFDVGTLDRVDVAPTSGTVPAPAPAGRPNADRDIVASVEAPPPLGIIEDIASPFRTAIGHLSLVANTTGSRNTAAGYQALTTNTTGNLNTAVGAQALMLNVAGFSNTAVGASALQNSTASSSNTAMGTNALFATTTGAANTAVGQSALANSTIGVTNTAVGFAALAGNLTGNNNTAIGSNAGGTPGAGTYNIFVGANVTGLVNDSNTIRIGSPYNVIAQSGQHATFIAGIRGTTVSGGEGVYVDPSGRLGSGPIVPGPNTVGAAEIIDGSVSAADLAASSVGTSALSDDSVTAGKVAFAYAAGTTEGGAATDLACVGCVSATEVGFGYAGLFANAFDGTQRIDGGNLDLGPSTATAGNVTKNGERFLHNPGFMNTFLGETAGSLTVSGGTNTALGGDALRSLATGDANAASGYGALFSNVLGTGNTASGALALFSATGSHNTAVGLNAGAGSTAGSHNIYVGAEVAGSDADTHTMRLGLAYDPAGPGGPRGQNQTFIAGIAGTVLTTPAVPVFVDANGQLGTLVPAPFVGTIDGVVTAGAAPRTDAALRRELDDQRALIAALQTRLTALETELRARPPRADGPPRSAAARGLGRPSSAAAASAAPAYRTRSR